MADDPHGAARGRALRSSSLSTLAWQPLTNDDVDALRHLARRCLAADGGLPQLAHEQMIRRLFLSGSGIGGRDATGDIVAAAAVFVDAAGPPHGDRSRSPLHALAGAGGGACSVGP